MYLSESSITVTSVLNERVCGVCVCVCDTQDAFQIGIYWPHTNTVHKSPAVRLVHEVSSPRWPEGGGADVLLLDEEGYIHTDITLGTQPGKLKVCVCVCVIITVVCVCMSEINLESVTKVCLSFSSVSFVCRLQ